jgi:hypothetical protein
MPKNAGLRVASPGIYRSDRFLEAGSELSRRLLSDMKEILSGRLIATRQADIRALA